MIMINKIQLNVIDFEDTTFRLLPFEDESIDADLQTSLEKFGILHPPILHQKDDGRYQVVQGRKRLLFCKDQNHTSCSCLILPKEMCDEEIYRHIIEVQRFQGQLSPVEQAMLLQKLRDALSDDEIIASYMPHLNLPGRKNALNEALQLLDLDEPLLQAVHLGNIDPKAALLIRQCNFRDRLVLFDVLTKMRLSVSNQRKCIPLLQDLALREETSIHTLLQRKDMQEILNDTNDNIPQQAAKFMQTLADLNSPQLSAAEATFRQSLKALNLPHWAVVSHAQSFENDTVTLTLTFQSFEKLSQYWNEHH